MLVVTATITLSFLACAVFVGLPTATASLSVVLTTAVVIRFRHLIRSQLVRNSMPPPPQVYIVAERIVEPRVVVAPVSHPEAGNGAPQDGLMRMGMVHHFFTKVAGTSHLNEDGSSRQIVLRQCYRHERLDLIHDKNNPHDSNAIKVCRRNGQQLGFIKRDIAEELATKIQQGTKCFAMLSKVTGGAPGADWFGANIVVVEHDAGLRPDDVAAYICELMDEQ